jgi:hypothetical protein
MSVSSQRWARRVVVAAVVIAGLATQVAEATPGGSMKESYLAQAAAVVPSAGPAAGRMLGGLTAQGWPVVMAVASNGRRVQETRIALDMHCTSGGQWTAIDGWSGLPIRGDGSVQAAEAIPPIAGSATTDALTGGSHSMVGKLNRKRATFTGTWHLHLSFTSSSGQTDECDSGVVRFGMRL